MSLESPNYYNSDDRALYDKLFKRSECPYSGIDCAWCTEECE